VIQRKRPSAKSIIVTRAVAVAAGRIPSRIIFYKVSRITNHYEEG